MDNYYFTFWIKRYGKGAFRQLINKVCSKITVPLEMKKKINTDEYLFHYFYVVYYTIALNYFGLDIKQISVLIDMSLTPGTCELFSPEEILKVQKDVIPEIENYVKKDLELVDKRRR